MSWGPQRKEKTRKEMVATARRKMTTTQRIKGSKRVKEVSHHVLLGYRSLFIIIAGKQQKSKPKKEQEPEDGSSAEGSDEEKPSPKAKAKQSKGDKQQDKRGQEKKGQDKKGQEKKEQGPSTAAHLWPLPSSTYPWAYDETQWTEKRRALEYAAKGFQDTIEAARRADHELAEAWFKERSEAAKQSMTYWLKERDASRHGTPGTGFYGTGNVGQPAGFNQPPTFSQPTAFNQPPGFNQPPEFNHPPTFNHYPAINQPHAYNQPLSFHQPLNFGVGGAPPLPSMSTLPNFNQPTGPFTGANLPPPQLAQGPPQFSFPETKPNVSFGPIPWDGLGSPDAPGQAAYGANAGVDVTNPMMYNQNGKFYTEQGRRVVVTPVFGRYDLAFVL